MDRPNTHVSLDLVRCLKCSNVSSATADSGAVKTSVGSDPDNSITLAFEIADEGTELGDTNDSFLSSCVKDYSSRGSDQSHEWAILTDLALEHEDEERIAYRIEPPVGVPAGAR